MKKNNRILIAFIVVLAFTSCSVERNIAYDFMNSDVPVAVLINPPEQLLKLSDKTFEVPDIDSLSAQEKDSALLQNSLFLKNINDEKVIAKFYNAMLHQLQGSNIQVFTPDYINEFYACNKPSFVVDIVQLQLEEYYEQVDESEIYYDESIFPEDIYLNALAINVWLKISMVADTVNQPLLLFATDNITDAYKGSVRSYPYTNEVTYKSSKMPLKTDDIYAFSGILGYRFSTWIYDYFINRHIYAMMPKGSSPDYYYHYDPERRTFLPANNSTKFEIIQ